MAPLWNTLRFILEINTCQWISKSIIQQLFLRHGIPDEIILDNGASFNSEFIQQLNQYLNIKILFTPPKHPSSNGIVERYMKTWKQMIIVCAHKKIISSKNGIQILD